MIRLCRCFWDAFVEMVKSFVSPFVKLYYRIVGTPSRGDVIRKMNDQELAQYLFALTYRDFELKYCQNKQECMDLVDTGGGVPEENCIACLQHYLQQPEVPDET